MVSSGTNPLGDPVVFSTYLIGQIANNRNFSASYNLDADRAYGYLCWDWIRSDAMSCNLRHQHYRLPVVPSEGGEALSPAPPDCPTVGGPNWPVPPPTKFGDVPARQWHPERPLQLRYPARECVEVPGQLSGRILWNADEIQFQPAGLQGPVIVEAVTPVPGGGFGGQVAVVATGPADMAVQGGGGKTWLSYKIDGAPLDKPITVQVSGTTFPFVAIKPGFSVSSSSPQQVTLTQQQPGAAGLDIAVTEQRPIG
jgi:hypothetical protein